MLARTLAPLTSCRTKLFGRGSKSTQTGPRTRRQERGWVGQAGQGACQGNASPSSCSFGLVAGAAAEARMCHSPRGVAVQARTICACFHTVLPGFQQPALLHLPAAVRAWRAAGRLRHCAGDAGKCLQTSRRLGCLPDASIAQLQRAMFPT